MSTTRVVEISVDLAVFDEGKVDIKFPNILSKGAMTELLCKELAEDGWTDNEDGTMKLEIPVDDTEEVMDIVFNKKNAALEVKGHTRKTITVNRRIKDENIADIKDVQDKIKKNETKHIADLVEKNINTIYEEFKEKYIPKTAGRALIEKARSIGITEPKPIDSQTVNNDSIYSITVEVDV